MKRLLSMFLILIMSSQLINGQVIEQVNNNSQQELYDFHMLKHKKNKIAAWVMVSSGIAMVTIGSIINSIEVVCDVPPYGEDWNCPTNQQADWLYYVGGAVTVSSIPFFISAGNHKRKAKLYLKSENVTFNVISIEKSNYLAIGLTIPF